MAWLIRFLFFLLVFCAAGWVFIVYVVLMYILREHFLVQRFAARLLAWLLKRIMGISVGLQVAGCNCLRDITVTFRKGAIESVSLGEIKLTLCKSLNLISPEPKLQFLMCDLEVVLRPPVQSIKKSKPQRPRPAGSSSGRQKLMVLINMARFLSVSVKELVIKAPKAATEIKYLKLDFSKIGGSDPALNIKFHLTAFTVQMFDSQLNLDQPFSFNQEDYLVSGQACSTLAEKNCASFMCEDLLIACDFGQQREQGVNIRSFDVTFGDVTVILSENLFLKSKTQPDAYFSDYGGEGATSDSTSAKKSKKNKFSPLLFKKHITMFPEKVSFNLPNLDVKFIQRRHNISINNNVLGIHLRSIRSQKSEDDGEATSHFDLQLDFSEIHLLREGATSVLEILRIAVVASIDIPMQLPSPIRSEIDVKLGGTQCNLVPSRIKPWLGLHLAKKKTMVLRKERSHQESEPTENTKAIMWTCTISAPDMTIVLYGLNERSLYHACSQSSHLFANNIASKGFQVHTELGELHVHMAEESQESLKEKTLGAEIKSGSLLHIARVTVDWGRQDLDSKDEQNPNRWKLVFSVDITGMGVYFCFQHVEFLILTMMSFKSLLKSLSSSKKAAQNKVGHTSSKRTSKGPDILKLSLEKCSVIYYGDVSLEDMTVADPKRVNFGSQGGQVVISVSADGTPRTASIISNSPSGCKNLKFSTSLDVFHLRLCFNKEKQSKQIELQRARSIYQEYPEDKEPGAKVTLLDMKNAKFVRRPGGHHEAALCSLFNVTDISVRWEPDPHLALFDFITSLRSLLHSKKLQGSDNEINEESPNMIVPEKEVSIDQIQPEKQHKKRESVFAIDVEMLKISAELADGVEAMVNVQSIFSENAKIGVLLEGLMLSFNEARIFKSNRMQISRIPVSSNPLDSKAQSATTWDWVIQSPDVHICIPYRLQLRAVDDAVEDTLRGLKLIAAAKTNLLFPVKKPNTKKSKASSTKFGSVRLILRKITAEIEEEPMQGWLDEHYQLMKNEVCEAAVRSKFLDEFLSASGKISECAEQNVLGSEKKICHNGIEIDVCDPSSVQTLQEEIHKQAFRSYYEACQKMVISEGSGAYTRGFQSGFKPSINRASVLSLCATELDVTLTKIEGGDTRKIEFIRRIDPISSDIDIPFSRMYGSDFILNAGSLVVQLRNYTFPLLSATSGKCQGRLVLAQQATCFQPQIHQDVFVGRWWRVRMLRSASGTTPAVKPYFDLPIYFHKAEVSFGVGYEPVFADISYAFTVALRRANLGTRSCGLNIVQPPKKERSLPWWDDMRYYIHGKGGLFFSETEWNLLATTDPYEKLDKVQVKTGCMEIQQRDGHVSLSAKELKAYLSSIESLTKNHTLNSPYNVSGPFLDSPAFYFEAFMEWDCESGNPLNHYLHAVPAEGEARERVFDPFRSTSLSLRWNFSLKASLLPADQLSSSSGAGTRSSQKSQTSAESAIVNVGAHDLAWLVKWWNLYYLPPHKLRSFSRFPRFGVPRVVRSGNLPLDKVMTENFVRLDVAPVCINYMTLRDDDPAKGMTFNLTKLKYEICFTRGKQKYTFDCKREPLDLAYQGLDMHLLKAYLNRNNAASTIQDIQTRNLTSQIMVADKSGDEKRNYVNSCTEKNRDDGFLLYSDYFTIRKQTPKADPTRLLAWQESGRKNLDMTNVRSEFDNGSETEHTRSDPSDDDGFNVVIADNCQRVFVYGLKLSWTIENRDAVWSFVAGISKAFEPPKPSPSRQYAQRNLLKEKEVNDCAEMTHDDASKSSPSASHSGSSPSSQHVENSGLHSFPSSTEMDSASVSAVTHGHGDDSEEEGTRHFMVNVIQPQFNLHSEEANGRFLLAAASGRILARSFHSVLHVGHEMIEKAIDAKNVAIPEIKPEMRWTRVELSVMLEHVQAHVAPTDVDPGAGLQWLPKILRSSPKVKRTGALLERVFMPCQMYFRYTRHKGGTPELKVKPLKELTLNSPNITATMTSRQFQVMLDVLRNLLFARLPKPRNSCLSYTSDDDEDVEEEADEVVPHGVEEVELARINLEQIEWKRKLVLDDIRTLLVALDMACDLSLSPENEDDLWMITGAKSALVQGLKGEIGKIRNSRKEAYLALRLALKDAAQLSLMEKEKNKSPSYAMRISTRINKVVWSMLEDDKSFGEAEINDMIYDFDRDYKDIGVARFTVKSFVLRNCLPNAKSDMLLSAWNAPPEWGKNSMLRVNSKQGAPKDGNSPLELLQVEIYPLKIHLTETIYRMMWHYFFPEEEQDSQKRQEVWKVSTSAGSKRVKKGTPGPETTASSSQFTRELESPGKSSATTAASFTASNSPHGDPSHVSKAQNNMKASIVCGSNRKLRRTSSFDRTWEETVAESVADELVLQAHSSSITSSRSGALNAGPDYAVSEETSRNKAKDSKPLKNDRSGRRPSHEEKKVGRSQDEKRAGPRKMMEFHNIKISQVELLVTYEGSRFAVSDLRLLMDAFHREDFTGTWTRLFARVKKHIVWGVLKSVTGMQIKKFKDKSQSQKEAHAGLLSAGDLNLSDSDGDQTEMTWVKRPSDGAGDGFVTSIRGLFNNQRRKAKKFVLRTMRGEADNEYPGDWSDNDVEFSPFARQLTITKAKKLIRQHTKKFHSRTSKNPGVAVLQETNPSSSREAAQSESDSSGGSSNEDLNG